MSEQEKKSSKDGTPLEQMEGPQMIAPGIYRDLSAEVIHNFFSNLISYPMLLIYFSISFWYISTKVVPYDFIDEKFHVNQTIEYIVGHWTTWDPKITTPPGLYILGYSNYKILSKFSNINVRTALRLTNMFGGVIVLPIVVLRPLFLYNAIGFWPVTIMMFPLLTTYYYLYYTDVWSTILILQSLTVILTRQFGSWSIVVSALLGGISIFFRQTNIIWCAFICLIAVERGAILKKQFTNHHINNYLKTFIYAIEDFREVVLPYAIVCVCFVLFVLINGSITLGDKSNHAAGLHGMQFFYCALFLTFFSMPIWISRAYIHQYTTRWVTRPIRSIFEILCICFVIRYFTKIHPFLLADNRHYTFYLFKRVINNPSRIIRYGVMSVIYHFSTYTYFSLPRPSILLLHPFHTLPVNQPQDLPLQLTHVTWTGLLVCTLLTIIPSPLFEPRYYILPYLLWRLAITCSAEPLVKDLSKHVTSPTSEGETAGGDEEKVMVSGHWRLWFELIWFVVIDVFCLLVFIKKQVVWDSEAEIQRIIW